MRKKYPLFFLFACFHFVCFPQQLKEIVFDDIHPFSIKRLETSPENIPVSLHLFSMELNREIFNSDDALFEKTQAGNQLNLSVEPDYSFTQGYKARLVFTNRSDSPCKISNIVPFGRNENYYYISGKALADTSRSFLFQPGKEPVAVVVPHNSNDLSFTAVDLGHGKTLYALLIRDNDSIQNYLLNRMPYFLLPGDKIGFYLFADIVEGDWNAALVKCFREKMLYQVEKFDNKLYERKDLEYIRHSYTMHLMMLGIKTITMQQILPIN